MKIGATYLTPRRVLTAMAVIGTIAMGLLQLWSYSIPLKGDHDGYANPWRGLTGCLYFAGGSPDVKPGYYIEGLSMRFSCEGTLGKAARPAQQVDIGQHLRGALQPWLQSPVSANPSLATEASNLAQLPGRGLVQKGSDVALTLNPDSMRRAQQLLNCMTGHEKDCTSAEIDMSRWKAMHEGAAARSIAMVQIDIASGGIDIMASARSECFKSDAMGQTGASRPSDCPTLSHAQTPREDWRDNLSYVQYAPFGSINKPWLLLALLRAGKNHFDPGLGSDIAWLNHTVRISDTPALLDRLLCRKNDFAYPCQPSENLIQAAADFGWNGAKQDLLLGGRAKEGLLLDAGRINQMDNRIKRTDKPDWQNIPSRPLPVELAEECASRKWSECRSEVLALRTAEYWGAGSASASPLKIAEAYVKLGAAANGATELTPAHLVQSIHTGNGVKLPEPAVPLRIEPAYAKLILAAMAQTNKSGGYGGKAWEGTTRSACLAVFTADRCNRIGLFISSKTGTPGFAHDETRWPERLATCMQIKAKKVADLSSAQRAERDRCVSVPYKWVAMVTKSSSDPDAPYTKVIVILSERNWYREGFVDSDAINISAEVAFRYLKDSPEFQPLPLTIGVKNVAKKTS